MNRKRIMFSEGLIEPSLKPGTLSLYHGGNLDDMSLDGKTQKSGRYEYGAGLYLTTHYDTAKKYAKGSRKLYMVTINKGLDARDATIDYSNAIQFVKKYAIKSKLSDVLSSLSKYEAGLKAYIFNNILVNYEAIKPSSTKELSNFLVSEGIDYLIVPNAFGWGETMIVLFNTKVIINVTQIKPADTLSVYDLPTKFN